jgi:hypothetical protein
MCDFLSAIMFARGANVQNKMPNYYTSGHFFDFMTQIFLFQALILAGSVPFFTRWRGVSLPTFYRKKHPETFQSYLHVTIYPFAAISCFFTCYRLQARQSRYHLPDEYPYG